MADSSNSLSSSRLIVALDFSAKDACFALVDQLDPAMCRLKIGKEMFTLFGPAMVEELQRRGFEVFLDLKFHDIPNTVKKAVSAAASLGVWMVNVHASGGLRMMEAAKEALLPYNQRPLLTAVTVLTSMESEDLLDIGITCPPAEQVDRLAAVAVKAGLDGVVCSAFEAQRIKEMSGERFICVTPGIRPAGADSGDQRRIMTPAKALAHGSDYLVVGRPITQAEAPASALQSIIESMDKA